jgi:RNA polymerase sigma-70 factor (ECF subfamily)
MDDALTRPDALARPATDAKQEWVRLQYEELGPALRRYLTRRLGDPGQAEDLVQETFLRMYEEIRQGRRIANPRSWTFQAGHNLAVDWQRRRSSEDWAAGMAAAESRREPPAGAEASLLRAERSRQVRAALCLLSPPERQCLELRAEGLRYREIADVMGLNISTVTTFVVRAVRKIARRVHE